MELIRGHYNLRPRHRGCVATIGNFDGLHLGHRAVLARLTGKARELGLPSTVITFEPHPQEFFMPMRRPARLTSFREKLEILVDSAVDRVLCLHFNRRLAEMPAEQFVTRILVDSLGVRSLSVGGDFRFGHRRAGDIGLLRGQAARHGFEVLVMDAVEQGGQRISSTRIRKLLQDGDLDAAASLLGRRYRLSGRIVSGDGLGRQLGFPTANIDLQRRAEAEEGSHCAPLSGVFAVEVFGIERDPLAGVANIGVRPTVGGKRCLLEVYLFDFDRDIYGRHVQVEFRARLRDELRFESLEALRERIAEDVRQARAYFDSAPAEESKNHNVRR